MPSPYRINHFLPKRPAQRETFWTCMPFSYRISLHSCLAGVSILLATCGKEYYSVRSNLWPLPSRFITTIFSVHHLQKLLDVNETMHATLTCWSFRANYWYNILRSRNYFKNKPLTGGESRRSGACFVKILENKLSKICKILKIKVARRMQIL